MGFDHLTPNVESSWFRLHREAFNEFENYYTPSNLHTILVPDINIKLGDKTDFPGFDDLEKYKSYRSNRDKIVVRHISGWADA